MVGGVGLGAVGWGREGKGRVGSELSNLDSRWFVYTCYECTVFSPTVIK